MSYKMYEFNQGIDVNDEDWEMFDLFEYPENKLRFNHMMSNIAIYTQLKLYNDDYNCSIDLIDCTVYEDVYTHWRRLYNSHFRNENTTYIVNAVYNVCYPTVTNRLYVQFVLDSKYYVTKDIVIASVKM